MSVRLPYLRDLSRKARSGNFGPFVRYEYFPDTIDKKKEEKEEKPKKIEEEEIIKPLITAEESQTQALINQSEGHSIAQRITVPVKTEAS